MNAPTDWLGAVAILAAGLVLGLVVFVVSRRRKSAATPKRAELEARRDALVQQLRDLGDDVVDDERAWLESETAEVLRALDRLPAAPASAPPPPRRLSATSGFALGVLCTLVIGGLAYYGSTFAQPKDIEQRLALAKDAFARNDLTTTFKETNSILEQVPDEPRALTYNAVVRMAMGDVDKARTMLETATQRDPKLLDAWVALASARTQAGDAQGANAAIESAIAQYPQDEKRLREVFAELQKPAAPKSDMPPDHPPLSRMTTASTPPSQPIRITLSVDPASNATGGVVYVIARGAEAGHPVAVRRIDAASFPIDVDLGAGDAMMGQALPAKVRIEARLDSDGDAGTNDPNDPRASADGVSAGATVALKLARAN